MKGHARPLSLLLTSQFHAGKMAAVLERSFIEICGFERETAPRFREVTVDLGTVFLRSHVFSSYRSHCGSARHHMLTAASPANSQQLAAQLAALTHRLVNVSAAC